MSNITERALAQSLKKIMKTSPLNKITINDIVNDCGVSRRTFYYHFQDIYGLLEWLLITEVRAILNENRTYETWQKGFKQILVYLLKNKEIIFNTYNSIGREFLEVHLYDGVFKLIYNVVDELSKDITIKEIDKEYIVDFYKFAFVGLLLDWIKNNMSEDSEQLIDKLDKLIEGDLQRAILKFEK
ncbi:TetR/AcrR family transcriptional regulator [Helicovermis profundi]|uniref:TetR/AcrR family transcriptional regulator n=2 Tax=Helicovermis profundi TaxID=3065157 RepID=A0AAU9E8W5_9FIRM|nr:TetR/AcrR family transcriptional regulator [Clostridia bacterium S502]